MEDSQLVPPERSIATVIGNLSHRDTSIPGEDSEDPALKKNAIYDWPDLE